MKLMANHTVDCKWCGEDIRAMGTSSVTQHEARCAENPASKSQIFDLHREALRAKYGAPRTSHAGGMLREYFETEEGKVIMFCSPKQESKDDTPNHSPAEGTR